MLSETFLKSFSWHIAALKIGAKTHIYSYINRAFSPIFAGLCAALPCFATSPVLPSLVRRSIFVLRIKPGLTFLGKAFELSVTHPAPHQVQPYLPW